MGVKCNNLKLTVPEPEETRHLKWQDWQCPEWYKHNNWAEWLGNWTSKSNKWLMVPASGMQQPVTEGISMTVKWLGTMGH